MEAVNELIDSLDVDALVDQMDKDVETDADAIDDLPSNFSDESFEEGRPTTIDGALQMPLERANDAVKEENWLDEMMRGTLREYVRLILIEHSEDVFEMMEKRKQQI